MIRHKQIYSFLLLATALLILVPNIEAQPRRNKNKNGGQPVACQCPYGASGDGISITILGNSCQNTCGGKCVYSHNGYWNTDLQGVRSWVQGMNAFDCYGNEVPVFNNGAPSTDPGANEPPSLPSGGGAEGQGGVGSGGSVGGGPRGPKPGRRGKPNGGGDKPGPVDPGPRGHYENVYIEGWCEIDPRTGKKIRCHPGHWERRSVENNVRLPKDMRNTSVSNPYIGSRRNMRRLNRVSKLVDRYDLAPAPIMSVQPDDQPASINAPDPSSSSNGENEDPGSSNTTDPGIGNPDPDPSSNETDPINTDPNANNGGPGGNGTPTSCPQPGCVFIGGLPSNAYIYQTQNDPEWDDELDDYFFPVGSFNGDPAYVQAY